MIPTIGVWWDLNTCPVPDGFDPRHVRWSIESALYKYVEGRCRVTIFAVGNLEYVSPKLLEAISSSGILIRHTLFRMSSVEDLLLFWELKNPPPGQILLISGDPGWYNPILRRSPGFYRILRAFPKDSPPSSDDYYECESYACDKEWVWENLLEENSSDTVESMRMIDEDEPAWCCTLCTKSHGNVRDFSKHLKGTRHKRNLRDSTLVDKYGKPFLFCELCQYPGYDDHNMKIHLKSSEHQHNLMKNTSTFCPFLPMVSCPFCPYSGKDMANHYNSEEHTKKELDCFVAIAFTRHAAEGEDEDDLDEEDYKSRKRSREEDCKSRKRSRKEDCKSRKRSREEDCKSRKRSRKEDCKSRKRSRKEDCKSRKRSRKEVLLDRAYKKS